MFYQEVKGRIKETKSDEITCVMGDSNAKVEQEQHDSIGGKLGLGQRNERSKRLVQFYQRNRLFIAKAGFNNQQEKSTPGKAQVM